MRNLWAPWRFSYIIDSKREEGCLFCRIIKEEKDEKNFVVVRKERCFIMLNLYPYNNGHLMISPYMHVPGLEDLQKEDRNELFETVANACANLRKEMNAEGFNIGINIGTVAGAGVAEHVHVHIVPRWAGDTNFMPIIGDTKVISEALEDTYRRLKKYQY
ncbi:MAG: HIT domain-containing protein [Candidatus Helarchaeota archaeon]|nr:HIT domain-containing protein [Candidatus Helarchaeota archaeon]